MNIFYIASVRIPNEKASGLAIMRQCEAFAKLGNSVTLLRPYRTNHISEDPFTYYGIQKIFSIKTLASMDFIQSLGVLGFYIARLSQMIVGALYLMQHRKDIDVIYVRDPWMLVLPVLFFKHTKIVWEAHQAQKGYCVVLVAKRANLLVCITGGLRDFYAEIGRQGKIMVEPSGVHLEQFENLPSVEVVRDRFFVPKDKKVIGYIGKYKTMGESKGVDELIEAFAHVYKNNPSTHLLIVGPEQVEIDQIRSVCVQSGLTENSYTLLPLIQKDFAVYVQTADVLVMNYPSTEHYSKYMSPTKLFAYLASKKSVVASDLPSIREIVDENMVIFVRPDNVVDLTEGLTRGLNIDNEMRKQKAFVRILELTWVKRAKRILG